MRMQIIECPVGKLREGMTLGESIFDADGKLLLFEGAVLKSAYIDKILTTGRSAVNILSAEHGSIRLESDVAFEAGAETAGEADTETAGDAEAEATREAEAERLRFETTKNDAVELSKDIMSRITVNSRIDTEKLYMVINQIIEEILESKDVTLTLATLREIDQYIFHHSVNVCVLSIFAGIHMGFNKVRLVNLGIGAMMHDVGKMLVPTEILNKPERLTPEEFQLIKEHTVRGFHSLREIRDISLESKFAVLQHHECFNGSGYPQGLAGDDIHMFARIVSIADVFDAITSDRVYCQKEDPYTASRYMIEEMGSKFDPAMVKIFLKVVGYYPVGLCVELNSGEYGVITKKNRDKPVVRILFDEQRNPLRFYYEVDLAKNPSVAIVDIDPEKTRSEALSRMGSEQSV